MAPLEVKVTISSAKDLKNVNWRHGNLKPYAVVWVDPTAKCSTRVDDNGDTCPVWDEKLTIPLPDRSIDDATLYIDIVHSGSHDDTKPLIGSARIPLREIVDEVGYGEDCYRTLKLKRPSGRPHGKLEVRIEVRELRYRAPPPSAGQYGVPYGQGSRDYSTSRDYSAPPQYGYAPSYAAPPQSGYSYGAPSPYGQPAYGQPAYGAAPAYGQDTYAAAPQKSKSKFGMGTGLAVGAAAGLLGGLVIAEGVDHLENKIADDVTERVEDNLAYDDGGYGDDF